MGLPLERVIFFLCSMEIQIKGDKDIDLLIASVVFYIIQTIYYQISNLVFVFFKLCCYLFRYRLYNWYIGNNYIILILRLHMIDCFETH